MRGERVQRRERLVEQQQFRLADQRPGQRGALGLAAGQGQRPGVEPVPEPDFVQRRLRPPPAIGVAQAERDVAPDLFPRQQPRVLEDNRA